MTPLSILPTFQFWPFGLINKMYPKILILMGMVSLQWLTSVYWRITGMAKIMLKKYYYKIIIISSITLCGLFYSHTVFAATIIIISSPRAGVYDVMVSLTKNESINAAEGSIIFNENSTVVPNIETDESIIPLWIKKPAVSGNSINFSGIIPGGFSVLYDQFGGKPTMEGKLFSIAFPFAKNANSYTFTFDSTYLYVNDGHGTAIPVPSKSITLPISADKNDFSPRSDIKNDSTPDVSSSSNKTFFILFLILFLIISFYFIKRAHYHIKRIRKK